MSNSKLLTLRDRIQRNYAQLFTRVNEKLDTPRWRFLAVAINYFRTFKLEGENAGISFYGRLWSFGAIGRIGLTLLLLGLPVVALSVTEQLKLIGVVNGIPVAALVVGLLLFSAGWAFGIAVSLRGHLAILCVACLYFYYYALLPAMGYLFNPAFAIPVLWTLYLVRCRVLESPFKSAWPLWVAPVCVIAGFLTFPSFGLHTLFEQPLKTWLKLALGAFYFILVTARVRWLCTSPGNLAVFLLTWLCLSLTYIAAAIADSDSLVESTILGFQGAITFFSLFMMWLGISFFSGAQGLGNWIAREWSALLPETLARGATVFLWLLAAVLSWLCVHETPAFVEPISLLIHHWMDVASWSYEFYFAVYGQAYVSLALVCIALILALRGQLKMELLLLMNGLWVAAFFMLLGYFATSYSVAEFGREKVAVTFWTLLLFLGGLTWRIIKSELFWQGPGASAIAGHPGEYFRGTFIMVAMLLLMEGVTAVLFAAGDQQLVIETRLQPLLGITYIGIPYLCYSVFLQVKNYPPLPPSRLIALFGWGCFSAFSCMGIHHYAGPHLVLAPLVWLAVLLLFKFRTKTLRSATDGVIAGAAMGAGFIAYWMIPTVIPIPFLELLYDWQASYTLNPPFRPHMEIGQLGLSVLAIASGTALAMAIYAQRIAMIVRVALIVTAVVAVPVLAVQMPGMLVPAPAAAVSLSH